MLPIISTTINSRQKEILIYLSKILDVESFILFGGAALDLIVDPVINIKDFDIGVKVSENIIQYIKERLLSNGYKIIGKDRPYMINMTTPVTMVFAENGKNILDISFLKNLDDIGQFIIESSYCRYPQLDYVDRFGAIEAYKKGCIEPIYGLDKENPYLLINRVISLSAKYGMVFYDDKKDNTNLNYLKKRLSNWKTEDYLHGKMARIAHLSHVLKAIARTRSKHEFIEQLINSNILSLTYPSLHLALSSLSIGQINNLEVLHDKKDVAKFLIKNTTLDNRENLLEAFRLLNLRGWDDEDRKIKL